MNKTPSTRKDVLKIKAYYIATVWIFCMTVLIKLYGSNKLQLNDLQCGFGQDEINS